MKKTFLLFGLLASIMTACSPASSHSDRITQSLDSLFDARYDIGKSDSLMPGGAVIISVGDSIVYESYRGIADMTTREPIDSATRFCIASVSKQFTVVSMLQQAAEGRLTVDDRVSLYFPEFKPWFWNIISLADLAGHTSGLPDARDRSDRGACIYANDSTSVAFFPTVDSLLFEPGRYYDYQNPTFLLLAKVVEQTSGESFCDYARRHLFEPAGMMSTYYFDPGQTPAHQSHGYAPSDSVEGGWEEYDYGEETFYATRPDGGIYSTARDMTRWQQALGMTQAIVPDSLLKLARSSRVDVSSSPLCDYQRRAHTSYGLGWFIDTTDGASKPKIYHTGDNGGYQAYVAWYPSSQVSVVVLENRHDRDRWSMALEIERILKEGGILK